MKISEVLYTGHLRTKIVHCSMEICLSLLDNYVSLSKVPIGITYHNVQKTVPYRSKTFFNPYHLFPKTSSVICPENKMPPLDRPRQSY